MSASVDLRRLRLRVQGPAGPAELEFADISEAEAVRRASMQGFRVLAIDNAGVTAARVGARSSGPFPLLQFCQELLALLDAGLNLAEALLTLETKERKVATRGVIHQVLASLREGRNFSDALAALPQCFPDMVVATVRAAERTGDLPQALTRFIAYQLQFDSLRKKLISAAIYPVMLLVVGGFVTLFLLGYVVPKFSAVYESAGRDMPWLSAALLHFGKLIHGHWQWAVLAAAAAGVLLAWAVAQPWARQRLLDQVLRLPWLDAKAQEFRLARFYRAVSLLLASGIALTRAMGMVTGLLSRAQQPALQAARLAVEQGRSLSDALLAQGLASPVADSLIRVGERSGQLADMLERTARFHDEDFARWIDWASRLLEPVLMALIGLVIGAIVVLMYIPIFELAGSL